MGICHVLWFERLIISILTRKASELLMSCGAQDNGMSLQTSKAWMNTKRHSQPKSMVWFSLRRCKAMGRLKARLSKEASHHVEHAPWNSPLCPERLSFRSESSSRLTVPRRLLLKSTTIPYLTFTYQIKPFPWKNWENESMSKEYDCRECNGVLTGPRRQTMAGTRAAWGH